MGLTADDLKVSKRKLESDYKMISQVGSMEYTLGYLNSLYVLSQVSSPYFPSSFLPSIQVLMDATRNWDLLDGINTKFRSYQEIDHLAVTLMNIGLELTKRYNPLPETQFVLAGGLACECLDWYDSNTRVTIEENSDFSKERTLLGHHESLCVLLEALLSRPRRDWCSIEYEDMKEQWKKSSMKSPKLLKRITEYGRIVDSLQPSMKSLFERLLMVIRYYCKWLSSAVVIPAQHKESYYYYLRCVLKVIGCGCVRVLNLVKSYSECSGLCQMVNGAQREMETLLVEYLGRSKCVINPVKALLFPERDNEPYVKPRRGGFPSVFRGMPSIPRAFKGARSIEDRVLFFTCSGDGVAMTKSSKRHNSWYFFSFNVVGVPCMLGTKKELFFSFIVPENSPSSLYCPDDETVVDDPIVAKIREYAVRATKERTDIVDKYLGVYARGLLTKNSMVKALRAELHGVFVNSMKKCKKFVVREAKKTIYPADCPMEKCSASLLPDEGEKRKSAQTAANSYVRQIMGIVLEETRKEGDKGIVVAYGDKLLHIRFAVVGMRADTPAADDMLDSAGNHASNSPCRMCGISRDCFDPIAVSLYRSINHTQYKHRALLRGFHGAFAGEEMTSELRWYNHLSYLVGHDGSASPRGAAVSTLAAEIKRLTKREIGGELWNKLLVLEDFIRGAADGTTPYTPSTISFTPVFREQKECRPPTNMAFSNGFVSLPTHLGFPASRCVCIDMMHTIGNVAASLLWVFFEKETLKEDYIRDAFDGMKRSGMRVAGCGTSFYWFFPETLMRDAKAILQCFVPYDSPLYGALDSFESLNSLKTHPRHVLFFCYLPVLLYDYSHIPVVRFLVDLSTVAQRLYNTRQSIARVEEKQKLLDIALNEIESRSHPAIMTTSTHGLGHLDWSIMTFGPLRDNDCYAIEGRYFVCKGLFINSKNSSMSLFMKEVTAIPAALIEKNEKSISIYEPCELQLVYKFIGDTSEEEIQIRTLFNYQSDALWLGNGLFNQITLWDIEKCTTIDSFVAGAKVDSDESSFSLMDGVPATTHANGVGEARTVSSLGSLLFLAEACGISIVSNTDYERLACFKRCTCNGVSFGSLQVPLMELTGDMMCNNEHAFAFAMDFNEIIHLYCIVAFESSIVRGKRYDQAWCYEVPTISLSLDSDTTSCRQVDLSAEGMKRTPYVELLSVRRLVGGLKMKQKGENLLVVVTEQTSIFQLNQYVDLQDY